LIGFPELAPQAIAKLARVQDLEKAGTAWQDQPRVPAGQTGGGEWTTDGGGPATATHPTTKPGRSARSSADGRSLPVEDAVYHPGEGRPQVVLTGGSDDADEGFRQGIGGTSRRTTP
jgi:hypothetical protein